MNIISSSPPGRKAGGGWYEHRTTRQIVWLPGLRNQWGVDRLGIPGTYLGNSVTVNDGRFETFFLPGGMSFRRQVETVRPEDYTFLKNWEDKAKNSNNILITFSFEMVNGVYVLVRAMAGARPQSISGRGLNPREKFEAGMNGFTTLASYAIPLKVPTIEGTKQGMSFLEFSRAMKGAYKGRGYGRGQQLKIKWLDYRQNVLHLELNTSNPRQEMEYVIQLTGEVLNDQYKN